MRVIRRTLQTLHTRKGKTMKQPLNIQFHGMEASAAVETKAREFADKLDAISPDLMACRVNIDLEQKHKQQGRPYGVRIDLTLPGHELVVNKVQDEDVYVALRDAFDNMKRQLNEVVSVRNAQGVPKAWISRRVGGDQVDYADEQPIVRTLFAEALAKHGLQPRMDDAYKAELADLPPKNP